jgi:hypothetical protein
MLRSQVLQRMGAALQGANVSVLLVKGAALALTTYRPAWQREMDDVDLLVRPGEHDRVVEALVAAGFVHGPPDGRPLSRTLMGETLLYAPFGDAKILVEVHTQLDKVVARSIDYAGCFARARPAPGLPGLLLPTPEDHALLVVLHAACAEFRHPVGFVDLDALLADGIDDATLLSRAGAWQLGTALFVALSTLEALGSSHVPRVVLDALRPGALRRAALARYYSVGSYPVANGTYRPKFLPWILRQAPLRDDLATWVRGVAHYARVRAIERV